MALGFSVGTAKLAEDGSMPLLPGDIVEGLTFFSEVQRPVLVVPDCAYLQHYLLHCATQITLQ